MVAYKVAATAAKETHVNPLPTTAPSANSRLVCRPSLLLAHHTNGRTGIKSAPRKPKTNSKQIAAPETPAACSEMFT